MTTGIEAMLLQVQFRWVGHVVRGPATRIPNQVFYGQLEASRRLAGGPIRRHRDSLKTDVKTCGIAPVNLIDGPYKKES